MISRIVVAISLVCALAGRSVLAFTYCECGASGYLCSYYCSDGGCKESLTEDSVMDNVNYNAGLTSCDFINITSPVGLDIFGNGINQEQIVFQAQGIYGNINIQPWTYSNEGDSNKFDVSFPNLKSLQGQLTFSPSLWDNANSVLSMPELECWTSISGNPSDQLLDIESTDLAPKLLIGKASSPFTMTGGMKFEQQAVDVSEVNVLSVGGNIEYAQTPSMSSPSPQYPLLQQIGGTFKVEQLDDGFIYSLPQVKSVGSLEFHQTSFDTVSLPKLTTFKPVDSNTVSLYMRQSYGTMQLGSYSPYISASGTSSAVCDCNSNPSGSVFLNCNDMCSGPDYQTFACPLVEVPDSSTKKTFSNGGDMNDDDTTNKNDDTTNKNDDSVFTNYHKKGNSSVGATIGVIATFLLVAISFTVAGYFYSSRNTAKGGGATVDVNIAAKAPSAPVANPMQASSAPTANEKV